jgi:hypothetical protein
LFATIAGLTGAAQVKAEPKKREAFERGRFSYEVPRKAYMTYDPDGPQFGCSSGPAFSCIQREDIIGVTDLHGIGVRIKMRWGSTIYLYDGTRDRFLEWYQG